MTWPLNAVSASCWGSFVDLSTLEDSRTNVCCWWKEKQYHLVYSSVSNTNHTSTLATIFHQVIESAIKLGYGSVLNEHKPVQTYWITTMATLTKAFPSSIVESAFCWGSHWMATSHPNDDLKHLCLEKQVLSTTFRWQCFAYGRMLDHSPRTGIDGPFPKYQFQNRLQPIVYMDIMVSQWAGFGLYRMNLLYKLNKSWPDLSTCPACGRKEGPLDTQVSKRATLEDSRIFWLRHYYYYPNFSIDLTSDISKCYLLG